MTSPSPRVVTYKRLWKLLIDRDMQKQDLRTMTGLSRATIAKLGRDENVTTTVLVKICEALTCDIADICEIVPAAPKRESN